MIELSTPKRRNNSMVLITMINLIFLLIFFFLIAGTVGKMESTSVNLPASLSEKKFEANDDTIVINNNGGLAVGDRDVSIEELKMLLNNFFQKNPGQPVYIKADAGLAAREFILVLKIISASGGSEVKLITTRGNDAAK